MPFHVWDSSDPVYTIRWAFVQEPASEAGPAGLLSPRPCHLFLSIQRGPGIARFSCIARCYVTLKAPWLSPHSHPSLSFSLRLRSGCRHLPDGDPDAPRAAHPCSRGFGLGVKRAVRTSERVPFKTGPHRGCACWGASVHPGAVASG